MTDKTEFDIRKSKLCFLTTAGYIPRYGSITGSKYVLLFILKN